MIAAEAVALMPPEERRDPIGPEISHAKLPVTGEDDWIGQDDTASPPLDEASLQVAEHIAPSGHVVGVVAEGLHRVRPALAIGADHHATVGVELLEVLNERL